MIQTLKKVHSSEIMRYGLVGLINTIFYFGVYALSVFLGFRYQIASLFSITLAIVFSFVTQSTIVFKVVSVASFARYISLWCALYLLNIWLIAQIQKIFLNLYLAGALATLPIALIGYLFMKHFVFALRKKN